MGVITKNLDDLINLISEFDTSKLVNAIHESGVEIKLVDLHQAIGITTPDTIYFDKTNVKSISSKKLLFVILHEFAHYKRIKKANIDVDEFIKDSSEKEYIKFVINEEIIADRYASIQFNNITKELFPSWDMQNLHLESKQKIYSDRLKAFYAYLQDNPELKYSDLIKTHIIND